MNWNDYKNEVMDEALEYINENHKYCNNWDSMFDCLWGAVTGNDNGSYYCNAVKAKEAVADMFFDDDYMAEFEALNPADGAETCDVIVRCNALIAKEYELRDHFEAIKNTEEGNKAVHEAYKMLTQEEGIDGFWDDDAQSATVVRNGRMSDSITFFYNSKNGYMLSEFDKDDVLFIEPEFDWGIDSDDIFYAVCDMWGMEY